MMSRKDLFITCALQPMISICMIPVYITSTIFGIVKEYWIIGQGASQRILEYSFQPTEKEKIREKDFENGKTEIA